MNNIERKIQAGEVEKVKAAEEVTRRNVQTVISFTNETRKMLLELRQMHDALQNKVIVQDAQLQQMRKQLASLQQLFYARGTASYSNGKG